MAERRVDVFFYGLFMDEELLRGSGVEPADPRPAYVDGVALRIGQRATLVPAAGARAYGMVMGLTHDELERLYSAPGLEEYRPEAVLAHPRGAGQAAPALCYNLRQPPSADERNAGYAERLQSVLRKLGFPADYVAAVG